MQIDQNLGHKEILKSIYSQILGLKIDFPLKPLSEFDTKWYRNDPNGAFILYPHPSIDDPDKAINGCQYPNVWVGYNEDSNRIRFGLAFWSTPSVDQRFLSLSSNRNEQQRDKTLKILRGLPDEWSFRIYKRERFGKGELVYENSCNKIDVAELTRIVSNTKDWRETWKREASAGSWKTPGINFMAGNATPEDSDRFIRDLFGIFNQVIDMLPTRAIKAELDEMRSEIQKKIDVFELRLKENKSRFNDAIKVEIELLRKQLESLELQGEG